MILINVLIFLIAFTHPLVIFPLSFVLLYLWLNKENSKKLMVAVGIQYLIFLIVKMLFFKTPYDQQAVGGLANFKSLFPNYFTIPSNKKFILYLLKDYYLLLAGLFFISYQLLIRKRFDQLAIIVAFFAGYTLLVNVSYANGADQFYLENQYLILSFFISIPLVTLLLETNFSINFQLLILGVICIFGLVRIQWTHHYYTARLEWQKNMLRLTEALPNKKLILPKDAAPLATILMSWGSAYEFWLLSTITQGESRSLIVEENESEFDWALPGKQSFITKWGSFEYNTLNRRYFRFYDTSQYVKYNL